MRVEFSRHASFRCLERNIRKGTVRDVLKDPDYVKSSFEERKIAVKKLEDRTIHAVFRGERKLYKDYKQFSKHEIGI